MANQRSYGAWGEVRQGATTGGPRARYCGNLGHIQDDETGLIYMRARYYEASSGRFISEDPGQTATIGSHTPRTIQLEKSTATDEMPIS